MPYDLQLKSGVILRNIPDELAPDGPEVASLKRQYSGAPQTLTREDRIAKMKRENPAEYDPESAEWKKKYAPTMEGATLELGGFDTRIPIGDKVGSVLANIGAGTADVIHGAKQRYAEWSGKDDDAAQLREGTKEKRRIDKELAASTRGGGALQVVGSALPLAVSALVPGGQSVAGGAVLGALTGAASGALQPTEEGESVAMNTAIGGALGGALPLAVSGLRGGYRMARRGAQDRAGTRLASQLGDDGGRATPEQLQRIAAELEAHAAATGGGAAGGTAGAAAGGGSVSQLLGAGGAGRVAGLQGTQAPGRIPLSAAAQTQNPALARLEQASRTRNPDAWVNFEEQQARAIADSVREATSEGAEIAARRGARGAAYRASSEAFDQGVDPAAFSAEVQQLREATQNALRGPEAVNTKVRAALQQIENLIEAQGDELTPAHVRQLRVELASKIDEANPLRAAPRDNPAIIGLRNQIDELLDRSGAGRYSPINQAYGEASRGVQAARAAQGLRNSYFDPQTGLAVKGMAKDALGEVPSITEPGLAGSIRQFGDELSPQARGGLEQTMQALRAQNITQRMKRTGSSGGGSDSAQNLTALAQEEGRAAAMRGVENSGVTGRVAVGTVRAVDALLNSRRDTLIAQALQDPGQMAQLLRTVQGASPEVQQSFMQQLRAAAARVGGKATIGGAAGYAAPQNQE